MITSSRQVKSGAVRACPGIRRLTRNKANLYIFLQKKKKKKKKERKETTQQTTKAFLLPRINEQEPNRDKLEELTSFAHVNKGLSGQSRKPSTKNEEYCISSSCVLSHSTSNPALPKPSFVILM
jgi:hypothetical protein